MHECYLSLIQHIFLYIVSLVAHFQLSVPSHKDYGKIQGQWRSSVFQQVVFSITGFILGKFNAPLWNFLLNVNEYGNINFKFYNTARNLMWSTFFSTPAAVAPVLAPSSSFIDLKACNKYCTPHTLALLLHLNWTTLF